MVRSYVRKTKQASWNKTSMKQTILPLKTNKMGLRKAARTFDVAKDSFRCRLQKLEKSNTGDNTDIIHKQLLGRFGNVLSESQEEELKKYITNMEKVFYGLTIMDIRVLVFEYCKRNEIDNPFSKETKLGLKYILVKYFVRYRP